MIEGVREAYGVIKPTGCSVYTKSIVENLQDPNSQRWMDLLLSTVGEEEAQWWKKEFLDEQQWMDTCRAIGFKNNTSTKIYGELPAPDTDTFPFENEMAQWMAEYVFVSSKE